MCRARAAPQAWRKCSSCRPTRRARAEPARDRSIQISRRASGRLSRRLGVSAARSDRPLLRPDPDRIVCGAGLRRSVNLLARAYLADGDEAIHTTHGFLVYPIATLGTGAKPIVAPETNYTASVDAILAAVTKKTKVIFLANPNNPTGTYISFDEVKRLHRSLPPHVLLLCSTPHTPNMSGATSDQIPASSSSPPATTSS